MLSRIGVTTRLVEELAASYRSLKKQIKVGAEEKERSAVDQAALVADLRAQLALCETSNQALRK